MTEIITNDREIDTRLEQGYGTAVAESMRRDVPASEVRHLSGRAPRMLGDHISGSVTGEWRATDVSKYGLIDRDSRGHRTQGRCRFRPERANTLLTTLAMEAHVLRPIQSEFARANRQGFTDSRACIIEEEQ